MPYSAGTAFLQVVPSFRDVEKTIRKQAADLGRTLEKTISDALPDGMAEGARAARRQGERAGEEYSGALAAAIQRAAKKAQKALPEVEINADSSEADKAVARIRKGLGEIHDQHINLDLDDATALQALKRFDRELSEISRSATTVTLHANTGAAQRELREALKFSDNFFDTSKISKLADDKFSNGLRKAAQDAVKDLPELSVRLDRGPLDAEVDDIRSELKKLGDQDIIGIDINDGEAIAKLRSLEARLKAVHDSAGEDLRLEADTSAALSKIEGFFKTVSARRLAEEREQKASDARVAAEAQKAADALEREESRRSEKLLREQGRLEAKRISEAKRQAEKDARDAERATKEAIKQAAKTAETEMGGFARRFRDEVDGAFKAVRKVDVDTDPAQAGVQALRDRLEALRDVHVGVDMDIGEALAEVREIRGELEKLSRGTRDIQVRADIAEAYAPLKAIERLADHLDGRRVNLDVDLDNAANGVNELGRATEIPLSRLGALVAVSASIGPALIPAAAAGAVAVGAIGTAAAGAVAGIGVLALSMFGIADAVKALNSYQQDAKKSAKSLSGSENQVANALDGIAGAERALRRAREDAAFSEQRSAQAVAAARRSVTNSEKDAKKAQLDLIEAIKSVQQAEEDRALQLRDNELAQRQANLDLVEAKKDLDKLLSNPRATIAEREQARITYEERVLQLDQLTVQQRRLKTEQEEANRKGVQGADAVVAAQERIAETQQGVADATQNLANAIQDQKRQQVQSADAILSAQENLTQSQRTLTQAYVSSGVAGGDALDTLKQKMDALSPAGRRFALFIFGLKDEFLSLRDAAAEGFLPGAQQAITNLLPYLPKVRDFISRIAFALGDVAVELVDSFGTDSWSRFFKFIDSTAVPTIEGLEVVTENVAAGTRDLFLALTAFNKPIGRGLIDMTASFAQWASVLRFSSDYQAFLAYVKKVGPEVVDFFFEFGTALAHLVIAAAPVGRVVLSILDGILSIINGIPIGVLTVIIGLIAAFSTGVLILAGIMKGVSFAIDLAKGAILAFTVVQNFAIATVQRYKTASAEAAVATDYFGNSIDATSLKGQKFQSRMSGLIAALGGGLNIALLGAGALFLYQSEQQAKANQTAKDLREAIIALGVAYKDTHDLGSRQVQDVIRQNQELAKLIISTEKYGISTQQVAKAAGGERAAQEAVLDALRRKREELERQIDPKAPPDSVLFGTDASRRNTELQKQIEANRENEKSLKGSFDQINKNVEAEKALAAATSSTNLQFRDAPAGLQEYVKSLDDLISAQTTAAEKTDILTQLDDQLFGAQRNLQESIEAQAKAHRDLNDVLGDKNLLDTKGARTLDVNTEAGQRLTDALEAELQAINATYRANVQNGDSIDVATQKHDAEIEALRKAAKQKGLDKDATEKLIEIYGQVPTNRVTTFATRDFDVTKTQLDELMAYQLALREGISLDAAKTKLNPVIKTGPGKGNSQNPGLVAGGPVVGPGTKTSDSVAAFLPETGTPFRLSNGEWVHQAAAVDYYGSGFMKAINERQLPKELLGMIGFGYAGGGLIEQVKSETYPFPYSTKTTKLPTKAEVAQAVRDNQAKYDNLGPTGAGPGFLPWPSSPMAQRGDTGVWRSIVDLVRNSGIPYTFGNAYRAGDPLWHGSGRAVDFMGYNQDRLATFFLSMQNRLLELIHLTPKSGYFVTRGKRKQNFAVQGPLHRNHLHVAMARGGAVDDAPQLRAGFGTFDGGGPLPPGYTLAYNGTGQTEHVLTSRQMADIQMSAKQSAASGNAYHFAFRDTTLDASKLRAIQNREAALARAGRAR